MIAETTLIEKRYVVGLRFAGPGLRFGHLRLKSQGGTQKTLESQKVINHHKLHDEATDRNREQTITDYNTYKFVPGMDRYDRYIQRD
jgi:hypothetical protein